MYHDVWVLSDEFIKDANPSLKTLGRLTLQKSNITAETNSATVNPQPKANMFLYKNFNVHTFYANLSTRGLNRYIFPFVEALNARHKLPKYILIAPDKDMIQKFLDKGFGRSLVMGACLNYIINKLDMYIQRRRTDLADKCPGATAPEDFPLFIWVRMLKWPYILGDTATSIFSLRPKFNSILEDQILLSKDNSHRIMSINVSLDQFDRHGNLTTIGKNNFWHEVDRTMAKLNAGEIKLLPRKHQGNSNKGYEAKQTQPRRPSREFIRRIAEQYNKWKPAARKRLWSPKSKSIRSPRRSSSTTSRHRRSPKRSASSRRSPHRSPQTSSRSSHRDRHY